MTKTEPNDNAQGLSRFESEIFYCVFFHRLTTSGRYRHLRQRLVDLDQRRQERRRRLSQLQELQNLLEPFKDPQKNIQPNLITRDGELFRELDKMRMLTARVGARINQKRKRSGHEVQSAQGFDKKLEAALDMA